MEQIVSFLIKSYENNETITREKLTYEVDTSYRNINRILKKLIDLKAIEINNGKIYILNKKLIERILEKKLIA